MEQAIGGIAIIFFLLLTVPFLILVTVLILKARKQSWEGVVEKKEYNHREDMDDRTIENFTLHVKLIDGSIKKVGVNKNFYNSIKEGEKIKKVSGQLFPQKSS